MSSPSAQPFTGLPSVHIARTYRSNIPCLALSVHWPYLPPTPPTIIPADQVDEVCRQLRLMGSQP